MEEALPRAGRPRLPDGEGRTARIHVRVKPKALAVLLTLARKRGEKLSDTARIAMGIGAKILEDEK